MQVSVSRREWLGAAGAAAAWSLCSDRVLAAAGSGPPLYLVERGSARAYIFGGALPRDHSWLTPAVAGALREAQVLWQEDPPTPSPFNRELNIELGARASGQLFDDLEPDEEARVTAIARRLELDLPLLQQMKPWAVGAVIAAADYGNHMTSYRSDDVKGFVQKSFEDRRLPIRSEVASGDDWVRFYAAFPRPAAIQYMLYQADLAELPRDRFPRWSAQWLRGDMSGWEGFNLQMARLYPDLYLELEIKRNQAWARRIASALDEGGSHFVFVGIQHTAGLHSIQAKCMDLGLAVRRV